MNLEQIDYLLEVAKEKSIRKAADKLHITPSAISQSILQIEATLGVTIFQRSNKGTIPTSEGSIVLKQAFELQCKFKELYEGVKGIAQGSLNVPLRIAFTPTFGNVGYNAFMALKAEHKELKVEIQEGMHEEIMETIIKNNGAFDIAFIVENRNLYAYDDLFHIEPLYSSYVCVAVGKNSSLRSKKFLTTADLTNESIAIFETATHRELVKKTGLEDNSVFVTSNNSFLIRKVVKDGHAICVLDDFSLMNHPDTLNGEIIVLPFRNPHYIYREMWAVYPKESAKNENVMNYLNTVKNLIRQGCPLEALG